MRYSIIFAAALALAAGPALAENGSNGPRDGSGKGTNGGGGTQVASNDNSPTFHTYSHPCSCGAARGGEYGGIGIGGTH